MNLRNPKNRLEPIGDLPRLIGEQADKAGITAPIGAHAPRSPAPINATRPDFPVRAVLFWPMRLFLFWPRASELRKVDLRKLLHRVETAPIGSPELDSEFESTFRSVPSHVTRSIDAATRLIETELPGWWWN